MGHINKNFGTQDEEIAPPLMNIGLIGWMKENLFSSVSNTILTILGVLLLAKIVPPLVEWAFLESAWNTPPEGCRAAEGACWSIISQNIKFILFGFYPQDLLWRPIATMLILVVLVAFSWNRKNWSKPLLYAWLAGFICMALFMRGGILGLPHVEVTKWSGLPLTLLLSITTMVFAYPVGVFLALGRQSRLPAVKSFCIIFIELIRGVPMISLLFMAAIMFPLFTPEGLTIHKIIRAQIAFIFFSSAYIAEVVRGGLQGMDQGQYEAADSIGLNYRQKMQFVVLPQVLKTVIPPTVSILIVAFKDTSLLVLVALYDLLNTTQSVLSDPLWMGFSAEAYIFVALLYFAGSFTMSSYGRRLERELSTEH